jgi:hypothetical protein
MANIILNILLMVVVIVPMVYFFLGGSKKTKEIQSLKLLATKEGLSPDTTGQWQSGVIGMDKKQNKLCYLIFPDHENLHIIDIHEIVKCDVSKVYQNAEAHNQGISILKKVYLSIHTGQKNEIIIPIFDASIQTEPGTDLFEAIDWAKKINNQIGKK